MRRKGRWGHGRDKRKGSMATIDRMEKEGNEYEKRKRIKR